MLKSYCLHQVSTTTRHVLKFKPRYIKKTLPKEGGIEAHQKPQNRKKNHQKPKKKFDQNRKPHAKLSIPVHFHIPVIITLIDPIQC